MWWKKQHALTGWVGFPGRLLPRVEWLNELERFGVRTETLGSSEEVYWDARLTHDAWGTLEVTALREGKPCPDALLELEGRLSAAEKGEAQRAENGLFLKMQGRKENVLRDRKCLLHFMNVLLGDDGVLAIDLTSLLHWSPEQLREELSHEAPLDIQHIHSLHGVGSGERGGQGIDWLHSHGLGEIGAVDFDVLRPGPSVTKEHEGLLRALAWAVVESTEKKISIVRPPQELSLVDAGTFMETADESDTLLRSHDRDHSQNRVVVCDAKEKRSWFGRSARPVPSRLFQRGIREGKDLLNFSMSATQLMAERARETMDVFDAFCGEFEWMGGAGLVKLGYPVDGGDGNEHLWFDVHGRSGTTVDATCVNRPFNVASVQEGQRRDHDLELLSDWAVTTPVGMLTPRNLGLARRIREQETEIRRALASQ